jgi:alkylation response protein AidB-like acyl-CoA dehydrogenase
MKALVAYLARATPGTVTSLEGLVARVRELAGLFDATFDRAVAGGLDADRVAYAFGAGYEAALARLLPGLATPGVRVLCVTEAKGGHPRAIEARLEPRPDGSFVLDGKKRWSTFGPLADELLVVATTGTDEAGRNRLRLARVDARRPGVVVSEMPPTPFAPELPHAEVAFRGVAVGADEVLEGDAYERFVKPFRTIEDLHVLGALAGHVAGIARAHAGADEVFEDALAVVGSLRALAPEDPLALETHLALAGAIRQVQRLVARVDGCWGPGDEESRARWERDRALLGVAGGAREKRRESAWKALRT